MSILVVCTANVARSPLAEVMLAASLDVEVDSAGTQARVGDAAAARSQDLAAARGLDLSGHRSKPVHPDAIEAADLVVTMATDHRDHCTLLVPDAGPKVFTLRELVRLLAASDAGDRGARTPTADPAGTPTTNPAGSATKNPAGSSAATPAGVAARADAARSTTPRSSWRSEDVHDPIQDPWPKWVKMGATLDELLTPVLAALGHRPGWSDPATSPDATGTAGADVAPRRWWQGRSAR